MIDTAQEQPQHHGWDEHADFSTYSDARLDLEQNLIDEKIRWAREDNDGEREAYYEQQMRMLQAERKRRAGGEQGTL